MALSYKNDDRTDERLNPYEQSSRLLSEAEKNASDAVTDNNDQSADEGESSPVSPTDLNDQENNQSATGSNTMNWTGKGGAAAKKAGKAWIKRALPTLSIGGLIFGGAGLGLFYLSPGLLIVQVKEVFTNYNSSASRSASYRYRSLIKYTLGNEKVGKICTKNPANIRCKLGTFSETQKANMEKEGFTFKSDKVGDRYIIHETTFPSNDDGSPGKTVKNGNEFNKEMKRSVRSASLVEKGSRFRSLIFNGARFTNGVLKDRFGKTKAGVKLSGTDDKSKQEDFTKKANGGGSEEDKANKITSEADKARTSEDGRRTKLADAVEKAGKSTKASKLAGGVALACGGYNIARAVVTGTKVVNGLEFAGFALMFFKIADQIKTEGNVDPADVAIFGAALTSVTAKGVKAGLSATDSQGYKVAAYGGESKLKEFTRAYLLGGNTYLIKLDSYIKNIEDAVGGRATIRTTCGAANNPFVGVGLAAASCAAEVAGGAGGGTTVGPEGTVAGAIGGVVTCGATQIGAMLAMNQVMGLVAKTILKFGVDALKSSPLKFAMASVDTGTAIAVGAGILVGANNAGHGLRPGSARAAAQFAQMTQDDATQTEAIARYDARSEPFNPYNQYSFLGSAIQNSGLVDEKPNSFGSIMGSLGTMVGRALTLTPVAGASSMPVNMTAADLSNCSDVAQKEIGIDCDLVGGTPYFMTPNQLNMPIDQNIDYMVSKGQIDSETGDPVEGSNYSKWIEYCSDKRQDPWGSTSAPIEDKNFDWATGQNCVISSNSPNTTSIQNPRLVASTSATLASSVKPGDGAVTEADLDNYGVYYNTAANEEDNNTPEPAQTTSAASISLTAATYNVRRIENGGSAEKTMQAANLMKTKGVAIFGAQEVSPKQFNIIKSAGFDGKLASGRGLFWDSSKLKLESYGTFMGKKDSDKANEPMQWAKFSAGGGSFYYINVHGDAHNNSRSEYTAQKTLEQIKSIQSSDANANIIVGGDMNGNTQVQAALYNNLKTVLKYSLDIASQKNGVNCDTIHPIGKQDCKAAGKLGSHRDMIFVSNGISIESWDNVTDGTASISDHNPVVTKLTIPGLSTGSVSMRASSFNLLGASHTTNWSQRMTKSIAVIDGSSLKDKQPLDIVGLQETTAVQQNSLKRQLSNYSFYPEDSSVQNPIMWNSSKFALVDGGLMPNLKYFNNNPLKAPWVLLKPVGAADASSFYVLNTHDPAHKEYAKERYDNANQHVDFIKKIKSSGKPIIFTGDFNSGFSLRSQARENITWQNKNANLTYCILTKGGLMNNAFDMSPKRAVKCPNPGNNNSVDHIYISPDVSVTQYFTVSAGSNGSDHDTQIADLSLSSSTAGSSTSQMSANSQLGPQGFSGGQCVDYVKWILARHSSKYRSGSLGNGGWVTEGLRKLGYKVDKTPAVFSTVSFRPPNGTGNSAGHTAIVTGVNPDGSIWVDESNYPSASNGNKSGVYGHRLVPASVAKANTTSYAHTEVGWH